MLAKIWRRITYRKTANIVFRRLHLWWFFFQFFSFFLYCWFCLFVDCYHSQAKRIEFNFKTLLSTKVIYQWHFISIILPDILEKVMFFFFFFPLRLLTFTFISFWTQLAIMSCRLNYYCTYSYLFDYYQQYGNHKISDHSTFNNYIFFLPDS